MTEIPDYISQVPANPAIHQAPALGRQWESLSQDQLNSMSDRLIESVMQVVTQALTGVFVPGGGAGGAVEQTNDWATDIANDISTTTNNVVEGFQNMWNTWFGLTTAAGTPDEVAQTFESVRTAVGGGFILQTFTANDPAWPVPTSLAMSIETYIGAIGGGGKGVTGVVAPDGVGVTAGGLGGISGGYTAEKVDASTFGATLAITVGAASGVSGVAGGITQIVNGSTILVQSTPGQGGMSTIQGYAPTTSTPGDGGQGGFVNTTGTVAVGNGSPGESSIKAAGGAGGAGILDLLVSVTAQNGFAGSNGVFTNTPIAGGGGGGGGGGAYTAAIITTATSGRGGNGGFPGGGSGGGGAAHGPFNVLGTGGTPANGMAYIIWRG